MGHCCHHPQPQSNKAFAIAVIANLGFTLIQIIYAFLAHSMSLLADAVHNLGDVLGLIAAWMATWLLTKGATALFSYGYKRTTIIAALFNGVILLASSIGIAWESILRLIDPVSVNAVVIMAVAVLGIVVNGGTALLFMRGRHHDLNIKGAFLHLAYDALLSLGVVISGIIMYFTQLWWVDPIMGLLLVVFIAWGTWGLLRDSIALVLDAVPRSINLNEVHEYLANLPGVETVHDLHVWGLSTRDVALTAHLIRPSGNLEQALHKTICQTLLQRFKINHVTLQVEAVLLENCGEHHCN